MIQCQKCGAVPVHGTIASRCEICGATISGVTGAGKKPSFAPGAIPWENLASVNLFRALHETASRSLFKPSQFFCGVSPKSSLFHAWLFGLVAGTAGILFDLFWLKNASGLINSFSEYGFSFDISALSGATLVSSPILLTLHMFFLGLYVHGMLIITGARHNTLRATIITACYAQSAAFLSVIPFFNTILPMIWAFCLLIIGTSCVHQISIPRAAFTILLPALALMIIFFLIAIAVVSSGIFMGSFLKDFLPFLRYY